MSGLARPGVRASILAGCALALHPAIAASRWLPGRPAILAALLVLAALGLLARAISLGGRADAWLSAAGAAVLLAALGVDGLSGHEGTLSLVPGQTRPHFDEIGPDGRSLGLRPLGFTVGAERVLDSGVALALPGHEAPVELTRERSVTFGGYRFARPRATTTGGASRLRVAASDGARTETADVAPGAPGRAGDLTIGLEAYFPDFALDENRQPFSRSSEPRNPAALLTVEKGGQSYRVFVLQAMPGVHRVEPLGLAFSLLGIEPEVQAEIAVHREPAALGVLLGAALLALGAALSLRLRPALPSPESPDVRSIVGGAGLALLLAAVDRGAVLAWSFGLPGAEGRVPLADAGVLLGAALVTSLGGTLLLGAARLAADGAGSRPVARVALWLAVLLAVAGLGVAVLRRAALTGGSASLSPLPLVGIASAAAVLAASLLASRASPPPLVSRAAPFVLPVAATATIGLAIAVGVLDLRRDGTYASPGAAASAAAALLGLAALESTRGRALRRFAFLLALLALTLA